jgi:hypothetical protein
MNDGSVLEEMARVVLDGMISLDGMESLSNRLGQDGLFVLRSSTFWFQLRTI